MGSRRDAVSHVRLDRREGWRAPAALLPRRFNLSRSYLGAVRNDGAAPRARPSGTRPRNLAPGPPRERAFERSHRRLEEVTAPAEHEADGVETPRNIVGHGM